MLRYLRNLFLALIGRDYDRKADHSDDYHTRGRKDQI